VALPAKIAKIAKIRVKVEWSPGASERSRKDRQREKQKKEREREREREDRGSRIEDRGSSERDEYGWRPSGFERA
jgi:hypothetical protein